MDSKISELLGKYGTLTSSASSQELAHKEYLKRILEGILEYQAGDHKTSLQDTMKGLVNKMMTKDSYGLSKGQMDILLNEAAHMYNKVSPDVEIEGLLPRLSPLYHPPTAMSRAISGSPSGVEGVNDLKSLPMSVLDALVGFHPGSTPAPAFKENPNPNYRSPKGHAGPYITDEEARRMSRSLPFSNLPPGANWDADQSVGDYSSPSPVPPPYHNYMP
jgi:hypothetical protein